MRKKYYTLRVGDDYILTVNTTEVTFIALKRISNYSSIGATNYLHILTNHAVPVVIGYSYIRLLH